MIAAENRRNSSVEGSEFESSRYPAAGIKLEGEELLKSNILADTRRRYDSQDEFVHLLYNDIAKIILTNNWRVIEAPKPALLKEFSEDGKIESDESGTEEGFEKVRKGRGLGPASADWKLILPDEYVEVILPSKNIYEGRVSRRQMEGDGVYRWGSGETYKGEFERNTIQGKGNLEWKDQSWYEGEFNKGHRHGTGNLVSREYGRFYTGHWHMGRKHGKGYCRYGKAEDFYDGNWMMDEKHGSGYRVYENGTRYTGQWEADKRSGNGTMVWPNGDVYRGEWKNGAMNGYGEYVWKGFLNESLSWPQENIYMGEWKNGMRHGTGILKLNSTGGAKYSGNWYLDKKHGQGMIIGNNGAVTKGDPLFMDDILTPLQGVKDSEVESAAAEMPIEHKEPRRTTVFKPLQLPPLSFHVRRLLAPRKRSEKYSAVSVRSGKCHMCRSEASCSCLYDPLENPGSFKSSSSYVESSSDLYSSDDRLFCKEVRNNSEIEGSAVKLGFADELKYEEHWLHNCLQIHIKNLRKVYKKYAELYCDSKKENPQNLSMGKIALWQLMRDCGIHRRGISLVQLQRYITLNKSAFIEAEFHPFERVEFFQFIHSLLEISWHIYTRLNDVETDSMRGRLAGGFHRLLVKDIFPNAGKTVGNLSTTYVRDLLPINAVYKLYCEIGEPHTAKKLLRATCVLKGTEDPKPLLRPIAENPSFRRKLINGINAITVGEKLSFIPSDEELIKPRSSELEGKPDDDLAGELFALRQIGAPKILSIMSSICPGIKDEETDAIVDIDYELTFLEFYEILLEASNALILYRKEELKASSTIAAESLTTSLNSLKSSTKSKRFSLKKK